MCLSPILFLCHRIPFPPNKGDKIATFNSLKYLSKHYQVHLGYFLDDSYDRQYIEQLKPYCVSSFYLDISTRHQSLSCVKAMLSGSSVTTAHYSSAMFQRWVDDTIRRYQIDNLYVYSSAMAQYINHQRYQHKTRILNMTDIDSDKWRQYALSKPWYCAWLYSREHTELAHFEQQVLTNFDVVTLVTRQETSLFSQMSSPSMKNKIHTLTNGVDTEYFDPDVAFDQTALPQLSSPALCFTGAMDYWANIDAVIGFCNDVWPHILAQYPGCTFYIVGGNPPSKVSELMSITGIVVTGRVPDVRPYLAHCNVVVAPMKIARGVQNKVLEAMAMAKPVVMSSMAQEGIDVAQNQQCLIHDNPMAMAQCINKLLGLSSTDYHENRQWIIKHYSWDGALRKLPQLINGIGC